MYLISDKPYSPNTGIHNIKSARDVIYPGPIYVCTLFLMNLSPNTGI